MKCKIPEISWHNRDPVLSVDIQPGSLHKNSTGQEFYRLATGGSDTHVVIWHVVKCANEENDVKGESEQNNDINMELAADLTRHQRAVNVVKWSPNGDLLASGDDESFVIIWKQKTEREINLPPPLFDDNTRNEEQFKEVWLVLKVLRGHLEDIYDLSWSPNGEFLVTGSVDNSAIIWDLKKGRQIAILDDHKGFVLGVAWDPKNKFIATLSTDRYLRIFHIHTKKVLNRTQKGVLPLPQDHPLYEKKVRYYHDDTLQTFFRRLKFSIDGRLLITPSGVIEYENGKYHHSTYIFARNNLTKPLFVLPCTDQYSVAVACCPNLYRLRPFDPQKNPPAIPLPYRMILAIATRSSVFFYDTQQKMPFGIISNIHYTRLTDISWSSDGQLVVVSSTDGFCSLISFGPNELGEIYIPEEKNEKVASSSSLTSSKYNDEKEINVERGNEQKQQNEIGKQDLQESETDVEMIDLTEEKHNENIKSIQHKSMEQDININDQEIITETGKLIEQVNLTSEIKDKDKDITTTDLEIKTKKNVKKKVAGSNNTKKSDDKACKMNVDDKKRKRKGTLDFFIEKSKLSTKEIEEKKNKKYSLSIIGSMILGSGNKPRPSRFGDQPAKPIPIRQTPRTSSSVKRSGRSLSTERVTNVATIMEEALDSWPTEKPPLPTKFLLPAVPSTEQILKDENLSIDAKEKVIESIVESDSKCLIMDSCFEHTEDIRLVYEDDTRETSSSKEESSTGATIGSLNSLDQSLSLSNGK